VTAADNSEPSGLLARAWRFLHKPREEKARFFYALWVRIFPKIPLPTRLPFGAWWLARNDFIASSIFSGGYETQGQSFVERYLRPGMVVLDVGAHHGYYTLLASKLVSSTGRVFSFEPSPRERKALSLHVRLNRCRNVRVQVLALGSRNGRAEFHLVEHAETGLNSLMPPACAFPTSVVLVDVTTLDGWLQGQNIRHVSFIKMDVEGGELAALQGATGILERQPRPVIFVEIQDIRTQPWGYPAKRILEFLSARGYKWFDIASEGLLTELDTDPDQFDGNYVAIPSEQMDSLGHLLASSKERTT
jgi:FkbM family methyltransferase